ncbi:MAG: hypothetical protein NXI23_14040 [Bacteroidetes bacterium]|nr:hypothetical protein [Bacteroidota bacterium]MDF1865889.1 hypothetical protein [Saprospiraceae bacterium]
MHKLTFFLLLTFFLNCKRAIPPTDGSNLCNTVGKIVDYTDLLDGCTFLIELENGERFNPIKMSVEGFEFKDGQKIKFGYIELEDMMSTCMAESAFVEITCIEDLNKSSNNDPNQCMDTKNPFEVEWMNKEIDRINPNQIIKYKYESGWAYLFKGLPDSYLYNCKGEFICDTSNGVNSDCFTKYINPMGKGKIIWQGEGIWD